CTRPYYSNYWFAYW
nr:immunoglobulin heavy chain junction region [Mus musculus]NSM08967.1 immunoglobulin heavy chain junction region [Mus musculus]